jgi:hypothetical protein
MGFDYKTMDIRGSNLYMLPSNTMTRRVSNNGVHRMVSRKGSKSKKKSV